jgi:hypothetical protein
MSLVNVKLSSVLFQIKMTICNQYQSRLYNLNQLNRDQLCFLFYNYDITADVKRTLGTLSKNVPKQSLQAIFDNIDACIDQCRNQLDYDLLVYGMLDSLNMSHLNWIYDIAFIVNSATNDLYITYVATSFDRSNPPPMFIIRIPHIHWMRVGSQFYNQ